MACRSLPQYAANKAAEVVGLQPKDLLLMTDADEIPHAAAVLLGANLLWNRLSNKGVAPLVRLEMRSYRYSLYHKSNATQVGQSWE